MQVQNYDARKNNNTAIFCGDSLATIVCRIVIVIFKYYRSIFHPTGSLSDLFRTFLRV